MAQGDTTIRTDFEVGGASAAKMTVTDVYKSQTEAMKKASNEEVSAARKATAAKRLAAQKSRELTKLGFSEERKEAALKAQQEASAVSLQRQRSTALIKIHNDEQAAIRKAKAETAREAKRLAQQQQRDATNLAKMEASQKGAIGKLMGRGAWGAVMGVAGYAGVAGISNIIQGLAGAIENFTSKRTELERTITPLASIGNNINNLSSLRKEVVSLAASTGLSTDSVAGFLNDLESSTGNLKPEVVKQLKDEIVELTKVKGGDIGEMGQLMVSGWQIAGKELKNPNELQNKLAYTEEIGKAKISQLANYLPTAMNTADLLGVKINEILGTVAGGSLKTGNIEKLMTGLRNFLLIMEQAPSKGINLVGSYTQKLEQLNELFKTNKAGMIDLFDREVVDAAYQIVSNVDDVKNSIAQLDAMPSTGDIVAGKLKSRLEDATSQAAMLNTLYTTLNDQSANLTTESDMGSWMYRMHERAQQGQLGGSKMSGGSAVGGWVGALASVFGLNKFSDVGQKAAIDWTKPGPERDILLKKQFEDKKKSDEMSLWRNSGQYYTFDEKSQSMVVSDQVKAIQNRQFDLEDARKKNPYTEQIGPVMASQEARDLVDALNKNTDATLASSSSNSVAKPGGSKVNSEETL